MTTRTGSTATCSPGSLRASRSVLLSNWLATNPALAGLGGTYAEDTDLSPLVELPDPAALQAMIARTETPIGVVRHALGPASADRLWKVSENLVAA